jgi:type VI secretion system secreted protein Hcp
MQDFHFAMRVNKAYPETFLGLCKWNAIKNALLTVRRSGERATEFLKWTLTDVTVASYQTASNVPTGEPPTNQVTLRFAKIEVEYKPMKPDGSFDAPINAGSDLTANRSA